MVEFATLLLHIWKVRGYSLTLKTSYPGTADRVLQRSI